ncbi:MAG: hypothetical protein ACJAVA_000309 [Flavobacteriaceae bacterium]|jgi:hypothetical protein
MKEQNEFKYMFLSRLKMDLEYFWGYGGQSEKSLYYGNYKEHIREAINLWKQLPIKPEWLRATELIQLKNKVLT